MLRRIVNSNSDIILTIDVIEESFSITSCLRDAVLVCLSLTRSAVSDKGFSRTENV